MTTASDNFDRANADPIGGNWSQPSGNADAIKIVSNVITADSGDNFAYWNAATFNSNHYSILQETGTTMDGGPAVRVGSSSLNGYVYDIGYKQLFKFVAGSYSSIQSSMETTDAANTDYKLDILGTTLKVYRGASQIGSNSTDSSLTTGQPGVFIYGSDTFNNWSAQDTGTTAYTLTCTKGTYTLTGVSAILKKAAVVVASAGSYTFTGKSAGVNKGRTLTCSAGSYTFTGVSAILKKNRVVVANAGTYTFTGISSVLNKAAVVSANAGSYTFTGVSATLTKTTAGAYTLTCDVGSYTVTGQSAGLLKTSVLTCDPGSYTLTGASATLTLGLPASYTLTCEPGSYTLSGASALLMYTPTTAPVTGGGGGYMNGLVSHRDDKVPKKRKKIEDKEEKVRESLLKVLEPEKKTILLPTAVETTVEEIDYSLYLMLLAA